MFPPKLYFFSDFNYNYMDIPRTTSAKFLLSLSGMPDRQQTHVKSQWKIVQKIVDSVYAFGWGLILIMQFVAVMQFKFDIIWQNTNLKSIIIFFIIKAFFINIDIGSRYKLTWIQKQYLLHDILRIFRKDSSCKPAVSFLNFSWKRSQIIQIDRTQKN